MLDAANFPAHRTIRDFRALHLGEFTELSESMTAVHQHLGLDDRHDAFVVADRGVTGQRVGVGLDREPARQCVGDVVDARLREPVESLRDLIARRMRERDRAGVDLDAGNDALARDQIGQRCAVVASLAERFLLQDDAADERVEPRRPQQQVAVCAPVLVGRINADRHEPLGDHRAAFIGSQDALAGLHQRIDRRLQLVSSAHRAFLHASGVARVPDPNRRARRCRRPTRCASARQAQLSRRAGSTIGMTTQS